MNPMTKEGESLLREELKRLKNEDRPRIIDAIATAREFGDLKENAEYHAAKEQQGLAEARIKDIEAKLSNSQIIDILKIEASDKVIFGTTLTVINSDSGQSAQYKIVGEDEADIELGKISCQSPIAKALIGNEEGDEITVKAPKGDILYEILEVRYI